ncbi:phosphohydrolase [Selenomonas sp.]|uniref:phosphohydrolase n=1 Tax=Selenomonas sp. TaxID=2053611 RepID=UPI003FA1F27C
MKQRILQFFHALTARLRERDHAFVRRFLREEERALFYAMDVIDQRHAVHTAYTALQLARAEDGIDEIFLVRIALLHDVGRVQGDLGLWGKVGVVLLHRFLPQLSRRFAALSRDGAFGFWRHALYVYDHHAEIGSEKLRLLGCGKEAAVIRLHHSPPASSDAAELRLLRQADSMN